MLVLFWNAPSVPPDHPPSGKLTFCAAATVASRPCAQWARQRRRPPANLRIAEFRRMSHSCNIFRPYVRWSFSDGGWDMATDVIDLDQMQAKYKAAVDEWIAAIEHEEELASVNHTVAELDKWEEAHFAEDAIRDKVKAAKKQYENALREKFFGF
jgi:hypothetical protein